MQEARAKTTAGPSTTPLAIRLREASLRMTLSFEMTFYGEVLRFDVPERWLAGAVRSQGTVFMWQSTGSAVAA
jgi:hypothetical protein